MRSVQPGVGCALYTIRFHGVRTYYADYEVDAAILVGALRRCSPMGGLWVTSVTPAAFEERGVCVDGHVTTHYIVPTGSAFSGSWGEPVSVTEAEAAGWWLS
jgi:hypothetical protein